jgi:formate dehydrogenase major subunit
MSLNSVDEPVNALTGSHTDRATHTPAFKESAVYMEVLPDQEAEHQAQTRKGKKDRSPLGAGNFRLGTRTPQNGVEIERKWARSDYSLPGTRSSDKLIQIKTSTV